MEKQIEQPVINKGIVYQIFSALFCEPEEDIYSDNLIFHQLKDAATGLSPELVAKVKNLQDEFTQQTPEQLLVDYTRIFLGPFGAIAHPYASIYLGEGGVNNEVTIWVENFYRKCGLEFDYGIMNLPDHLVVELEFLYNLLHKELEAEQESNYEKAALYSSYRDEFLTEHFISWTGKMAEQIMESNVSTYYSALSQLLLLFAVYDRKSLQVSV